MFQRLGPLPQTRHLLNKYSTNIVCNTNCKVLHFSSVIFPTAIDFTEPTSTDDAVNAKITECDVLGSNKLHVLPLAKSDVRITNVSGKQQEVWGVCVGREEERQGKGEEEKEEERQGKGEEEKEEERQGKEEEEEENQGKGRRRKRKGEGKGRRKGKGRGRRRKGKGGGGGGGKQGKARAEG